MKHSSLGWRSALLRLAVAPLLLVLGPGCPDPPCDTEQLSTQGEGCFGEVGSAVEVSEVFPSINPDPCLDCENLDYFYYYKISPHPDYCGVLQRAHAAAEEILDAAFAEAGGDGLRLGCEEATAYHESMADALDEVLGPGTSVLHIELFHNGVVSARENDSWPARDPETSGEQPAGELNKGAQILLHYPKENIYRLRAQHVRCGVFGVEGYDRNAAVEGLGRMLIAGEDGGILGVEVDEGPTSRERRTTRLRAAGLPLHSADLWEHEFDRDPSGPLTLDVEVEECVVNHRYDVWTFTQQPELPRDYLDTPL